MTISVFGFVSRDIVRVKSPEKKDTVRRAVGGKAYYSGLCLANLGEETAIFTYLDKESRDLSDLLSLTEAKVFSFEADSIPTFENIYLDDFLNCRRVKAQLSDFCFRESSFTRNMTAALARSDYIHLGPSRMGELPLEFVKFLREKSSARFSADLDYIVKKVSPGGNYIPESFDHVNSFLSFLDVAIISRGDADFMGYSTEKEALCSISEQGPDEVILTLGSKGAVIYSKLDDRIHSIPPVQPIEIVDTTGAGDTYIAAYLFARKNKSVEESGKFAAEIASLRIGQRELCFHK